MSIVQNWIDPKMPQEIQTLAQKVLEHTNANGLRVRLQGETLYFTQDRRVVEMPVELIKKEMWSDVRFLFRAILDSAPSSWNMSADNNDWSAYKH